MQQAQNRNRAISMSAMGDTNMSGLIKFNRKDQDIQSEIMQYPETFSDGRLSQHKGFAQ